MLNTDITSVYDANTINPSGYYLTDSASKYLNGSNISSNIMTPLIWDQKMNQYQDHRNTFLGTATITFKLSKAFSLRVRGGTDRLFDFVEQKRPFTAYAAATNLTLNPASSAKKFNSGKKKYLIECFSSVSKLSPLFLSLTLILNSTLTIFLSKLNDGVVALVIVI